jgi:hypothetical protein
MARFLGLLSFMPSHMAAWTRVSFSFVPLDGEVFFWAKACDKKEVKKTNAIKYVSRLYLVDMLLSLVIESHGNEESFGTVIANYKVLL